MGQWEPKERGFKQGFKEGFRSEVLKNCKEYSLKESRWRREARRVVVCIKSRAYNTSDPNYLSVCLFCLF
jgi:hypothetical protein